MLLYRTKSSNYTLQGRTTKTETPVNVLSFVNVYVDPSNAWTYDMKWPECRSIPDLWTSMVLACAPDLATGVCFLLRTNRQALCPQRLSRDACTRTELPPAAARKATEVWVADCRDQQPMGIKLKSKQKSCRQPSLQAAKARNAGRTNDKLISLYVLSLRYFHV